MKSIKYTLPPVFFQLHCENLRLNMAVTHQPLSRQRGRRAAPRKMLFLPLFFEGSELWE
jgi:hypothetical protein